MNHDVLAVALDRVVSVPLWVIAHAIADHVTTCPVCQVDTTSRECPAFDYRYELYRVYRSSGVKG